MDFHEQGLFKFETTVGAAIPVVKTVYDVWRARTQQISKIEGMFSGTLNYVLSKFFDDDKEMSFYDTVKK